jgi:gas vesicle protein
MDEPLDNSPEINGHSVASILLGVGVGALIGVAAAILFAPQSGSETRQDLGELPAKVKERTDEMIAELKQNLDDLSAKSRELVDSTRARVDAAIQAGKEAAQEKKQELESQVHSTPEEAA